ncbi:MAG: hypothetical protein ACKV2U_04185 [Bryobacteraceae bacterium]
MTAASMSLLMAGLALGQVAALDSETDPDRLQAAAVAIAVAGDAPSIAQLARRLGDAAFLRRLDPPTASSTPVVRVGRIFDALREHPSQAAEALCLALSNDAEFNSVLARRNGLLAVLAARKPLSATAAAVLRDSARNGFVETVGPLLARNRSARAMALLEELLAEDALPAPQRIYVAHAAIVPNRNDREFVRLSARLIRRRGLARPVVYGIAESLFDYQPKAWFGASPDMPEPPPRSAASPEVRKLLRELAAELRVRQDLPPSLPAAMRNTLAEIR